VVAQTLFVAETPTLPNINEGSPVTVSTTVVFAVDGTLDGFQIYAPATVSGTFSGAAWQITADDSPADTGTGTLIASVAMPSLTPSVWQQVMLAVPVAVTAGTPYRIGYRTSEGRYAATGGGFNSAGMTNGDISAPQTGTVLGIGTIANGTFIESVTLYPNKTFNGNKYFIGPVFTAGGATTPITSSITVKWRVYGKVSSGLTGKWRVYQKVTSILTTKWRVYAKVSTALTAKWRVYQEMFTSLTGKWRNWQRVTSSLVAKWTNFGAPTPPPVVSTTYLTAQRAATAAYIRDDPTTLVLVPRSRTATPTGGFTYTDGAPRPAQTVKMILLSSDERPRITVAGVERKIDYHLLGAWNMQIAVGDIWESDDGTTWEVLGFTEGWDYMTKAFVGRQIPRTGKA
jgi:hypothetical protein